jgi:UDP-2,4-diacetamido-2,4,6-trideoxy-beta-L-altropyranose hydrolase
MTEPVRSRTLKLRRAGPTDASRLFEWANHPDSRRASLEAQNPIAWNHHRAWFAARLADPRTRIWMIEVDRRAVGQVRLQDKGEGPEIAIYVEPGSRREGVAVRALAMALVEARLIWPGRDAIARVRAENAASRRLFERARFTPRRTAAEALLFTHPIER